LRRITIIFYAFYAVNKCFFLRKSTNLIFQSSFLLFYKSPNAPIPPSIVSNTAINKESINDKTNPAIASPLGFFNTPANDRIRPKTHKIQSKTNIRQQLHYLSADVWHKRN